MPDNLPISTPPAEPPALLSRVGRYVLRGEIGRGYSSVVFEALDTRSGEMVAIKILMPPAGLSPARREEMVERFAREARAVAALSHPAIVSVREAGQDADGHPFLTMEILRGETLRARLSREGALPPEEAVPIALHLADGLRHAHERGIVHRDVKPDNVFLLSDGQVKLMDFGVAQMLSDSAITQTGTVVGSPAYMSPEQINGGKLDAGSDVFSLGVTLAEMVTGRKPFEAPTIPAVMHRILYRAPDLAGVVPRPLRPVLERALARRRAARYPDMAAFSAALRERVLPRLAASALERPAAWALAPAPLLPGHGTGAGEATRLAAARSEGALVHDRTARTAGRAALGLGLLALLALPFGLGWLHWPGEPREETPSARPFAQQPAPVPATHAPNAEVTAQIPVGWRRVASAHAAPTPPSLTHSPPVRPAEADAAGWDGVVIVRAQVKTDGTVGSVQLTGPSHLTAVDNAALHAVRGWRYAPSAQARTVTERVTFASP